MISNILLIIFGFQQLFFTSIIYFGKDVGMSNTDILMFFSLSTLITYFMGYKNCFVLRKKRKTFYFVFLNPLLFSFVVLVFRYFEIEVGIKVNIE